MGLKSPSSADFDHGQLQGLSDLDHPQYIERTGVDSRTATFSYAAGVLTVVNAGSFDVWCGGVKYTKTANETVALASDNTLYYVYWDTDGVLKASTSPWSITGNAAPCATVFRVSASLAAIGDERHTSYRSKTLHAYLHETVGARYDIVDQGLTGSFTTTTFSINPGAIWDEDLEHTITPAKTTCRLWYRSGASNMTFEDSITVPYKLNGTNLRYDNGGSLADAGPNNWVCSYVYATNDVVRPIYVLLGQATHATLAAAQNEAVPTFAGLSTIEWKLIYKLIWRNTGSPPTLAQTIDYRTAGLIGVTAVAVDHGALTGLLDDDHTQYALLAGRAGGQTLYGGTATGDDLVLDATSHATGTGSRIILQGSVDSTADLSADNQAIEMSFPVTTQLAFGGDGSSPYTVWMQVKQTLNSGLAFPLCLQPLGGHLGIQNMAPDAEVHLKKSLAGAVSMKVENLNGGDTTQARFYAVSDTNSCIFGVTGSGDTTDFGASYAGCAYIYGSANKPMIFATNSIIRLIIQADGVTDAAYGLKIGGKSVSFGANDSAGAGYRTMKIENA